MLLTRPDGPGLCDSLDDEQARGLRLLLLGKGAVFAHRFEPSLTAEMDEMQSSAGCMIEAAAHLHP